MAVTVTDLDFANCTCGSDATYCMWVLMQVLRDPPSQGRITMVDRPKRLCSITYRRFSEMNRKPPWKTKGKHVELCSLLVAE